MQTVLPFDVFLKTARVSIVDWHYPAILNHIIVILLIDMQSIDRAYDPVLQWELDELHSPLANDLVIEFLPQLVYNLTHHHFYLPLDYFPLQLPMFIEH